MIQKASKIKRKASFLVEHPSYGRLKRDLVLKANNKVNGGSDGVDFFLFSPVAVRLTFLPQNLSSSGNARMSISVESAGHQTETQY